MSDKPVWKWGWTTFDEIRLEKEAKRLCTLAEQYEGVIRNLKNSIGDIEQGLNTDSGEKLSNYVSDLCVEAEETAQKMREAAAGIRKYNDHMLTLWELFQKKLKDWEASLVGEANTDI